MKINLHMHSTLSDGKKTIPELFQMAESNEIEIISITDHDSLESTFLLSSYSGKVKKINGIEFTSQLDDELDFYNSNYSIHILGYDFDSDKLSRLYSDIIIKREDAVKAFCLKLKQNGIEFDENKFFSSRTKLAHYLLEKGIAKNFIGAIHFINEESNFSVCLPTVKQVIDIIHRSDGYAIWAHPYEMLDYSSKISLKNHEIDYLCSELTLLNIDGLEAYYGKYTIEENRFLLSMIDKYNFITSAGTDYHGKKEDEQVYMNINDSRLISNVISNNGDFHLSGGRITKEVIKNRQIVYRQPTKNDKLIKELLLYFEKSRFKSAPKYIGLDEKGRNKFGYISGYVPNDIGSTTLKQLEEFIKIVRKMHDISNNFLGDKVICHHDLSPCNVVFRRNMPFAIIDWDCASIGERWEDITYILWLWLNVGDTSKNANDLISQMQHMIFIYGDESIAKDFVKKMLTTMDRVLDSFPKENIYYLKTKNWVIESKNWVKQNKNKIRKMIG